MRFSARSSYRSTYSFRSTANSRPTASTWSFRTTQPTKTVVVRPRITRVTVNHYHDGFYHHFDYWSPIWHPCFWGSCNAIVAAPSYAPGGTGDIGVAPGYPTRSDIGQGLIWGFIGAIIILGGLAILLKRGR